MISVAVLTLSTWREPSRVDSPIGEATPTTRPRTSVAVLSVFLFGGNLRIKPSLHELPLP
jgi:hypothetical protein